MEGNVATVAVDVEAVEGAVAQGCLVDVVGTEDAPVGAGRKTDEAAVPDIVHLDAVAVKVRARVGALDVYVLQRDVGAIPDIDGRIGVHVFRIGSVDVDIADFQVVDAFDVETVGLRSGSGIAGDGEVSDGFQLLVGAVVFDAYIGGIGGVGGDRMVDGVIVLHEQDVLAHGPIRVAGAVRHPRVKILDHKQIDALGELFSVVEGAIIHRIRTQLDSVPDAVGHGEEVVRFGVVLDGKQYPAEVVAATQRDGLGVLGDFDGDSPDPTVGDLGTDVNSLQVSVVEYGIACAVAGGLRQPEIEWGKRLRNVNGVSGLGDSATHCTEKEYQCR